MHCRMGRKKVTKLGIQLMFDTLDPCSIFSEI